MLLSTLVRRGVNLTEIILAANVYEELYQMLLQNLGIWHQSEGYCQG